MWKCGKCNEMHADHFSTCWKCAGMEAPPRNVGVASASVLPCARCNTEMQTLGTRTLPGASTGGILGELSELFANREKLEVFACPHCGCVEFFVEGIGQAHRSIVTPTQQSEPVAPSYVERAQGQLHEAGMHESHGELETAVIRYEDVIAKYPGTVLARDAEERLREIKLKLDL